MKDIKCPYCQHLAFQFNPTTELTCVRIKCANPSCRHRYRLVTRMDRITQKLSFLVFASAWDKKTDGKQIVYDLNELSALTLPELREFVNRRDDEVIYYTDYLASELDEVKKYVARAEREERERLKALARVNYDGQVATAALAKKRPVSATSPVAASAADDTMREQLRLFIGLYVKRKKMTPQQAEILLKRLHTRQGMEEAAAAVKIPNMLED